MQKCGKICVGERVVGSRIYSNLEPILIEWETKRGKKGLNIWRLDNFLPMNKEVVEKVKGEILLFFQANGRMVYNILLWETFKAFMHDILIRKHI